MVITPARGSALSAIALCYRARCRACGVAAKYSDAASGD